MIEEAGNATISMVGWAITCIFNPLAAIVSALIFRAAVRATYISLKKYLEFYEKIMDEKQIEIYKGEYDV